MTASTARRSRFGIAAAIAVLVLTVVGTGWLAWDRRTADKSADLGTRTVAAGPVTVTITALTLDTTGARFKLAFDTHTGSLDLDPATAAHLTINGTEALQSSWTGDGPGGHHRVGTLTFTTPVPAAATVELRLTGLPRDTTAIWTAP